MEKRRQLRPLLGQQSKHRLTFRLVCLCHEQLAEALDVGLRDELV